jgi:hypothetical protein
MTITHLYHGKMSNPPSTWQLFVVSVPTHGATLRMRIWRTLKALGCAALRDGAYLLPGKVAQDELHDLLNETVKEGGSAWLLAVQAQHPQDDAAYQALFDRTDDYAEWEQAVLTSRRSLHAMSPQELKKTSRKLRRDLDAIVQIDFFPNEASARAAAEWKAFSHAVDLLLGSDEPKAEGGRITRLPRDAYQGRTWATRRNMWVDRVASAWLIRRWIDLEASFLWLASPADCPPDALGFDFDGAAFTHVGELVTFQVLAASFGLDGDPGLVKLGAMVNALDLGKTFVPEAAGFEAILAGARQCADSDDDLLLDMSNVLDSLYLHFASASQANRS